MSFKFKKGDLVQWYGKGIYSANNYLEQSCVCGLGVVVDKAILKRDSTNMATYGEGYRIFRLKAGDIVEYGVFDLQIISKESNVESNVN